LAGKRVASNPEAMPPRNPNAFANSPLDRAGHRRRDAAWLEAALADNQTCLVAVFHERKPLLFESGGRLFTRYLANHVPAEFGKPGSPVIFMGVDRDEQTYFACEIADPAPLADYGAIHDLRGASARLEPDALAILGCARAILEWHARNNFCASCGARSEAAEAGWKRVCPACKAEHFPRVDPVAIMLPVFADKCLLARQRMFPPRMYSALAGYIEPGESIEEGAARETLEEAGLRTRAVRLHSNQPWPFPHSLMIGAIIEVEHDDERLDPDELEAARWFSREEARALIEGQHPDAFCPPPFAIAHQLIKSWAFGD
jgi:NAD+ diphosphatase